MPRKQHIYHYIYKTTCNVNGKYYVGMHSTSNLEDGYIGSGKKLWNSIRKHGRENHSLEILEWFPDRSSLKEREKELVNESLLQDPMCMNLQLGGGGGFVNEEHKMKCLNGLSIYMKNLWKDSIYFEKMRRKSSFRMKKLHSNGLIKYDTFKGKIHSENTLKKMRESKIDHGLGEKNSQFGTQWITNDFENKKIKRTDSIPDGWKKGRKMRK